MTNRIRMARKRLSIARERVCATDIMIDDAAVMNKTLEQGLRFRQGG